jgi:hypothetical protein
MVKLGLKLLCLTFFALGVLNCSFPTTHGLKASQYYQQFLPECLQCNLVLVLGVLSMATVATLTAKPCIGVWVASVTLLGTMAMLGNPFLPVYNESEKYWALVVSYQALGVLGATLLVKG